MLNSIEDSMETESSYYVMGTGSRSMRTDPHSQEIFDRLNTYIHLLQKQYPNLVLISGMAEGWDEAIAKAAIAQHIPFIAAIPNPGYGDYYWTRNSVTKRDRTYEYANILSKAIEIVYVCNGVYKDGVHANFVRNQWMVDKCDHALVYNPTSSGTRDAIARLKQAGKSYEVYPFIRQETLGV